MSTPKIPAFRAQATIRNLGAIREAHLDLRPLTVLFGHNGVNKTWAAYSIVEALNRSCIFGSGDQATDKVVEGVVERLASALEPVMLQLEEILDVSMDADPLGGRQGGLDFVLEVPWLGACLDEIYRMNQVLLGSGWISKVLGLPESVLLGATVSVQQMRDAAIDTNFRSDVRECLIQGISRKIVGSSGNWYISVLLPYLFRRVRMVVADVGEGPVGSGLDVDALRTWVAGHVSVIGKVFPLPAERTALQMLSREIEDLSEMREIIAFSGLERAGTGVRGAARLGRLQAIAENETILPKPCEDLVRLISWWRSRAATPHPDVRLSGVNLGPMGLMAERLQTSIIGGVATLASYGDRPSTSEMRFRDSKGVDLPIHAASSLAGSLGLLDVWLRVDAEPGDLVLIDEPEMNAHPETQVKIAELLAMLVNAGLRVIITTHSPYLVEHLEGLMLGSRLDPEARARFVDRLALKDEAAWLDPEDLAVYHFEEQADGEVKVQDVLNRQEASIDWTTFSRPIAFVGNLINNILAELGEGDTE